MYVNGFSAINILTEKGENELSFESASEMILFKKQAYQAYKNYLTGAVSRRMSPSVKMSATAALQIKRQADFKKLDGIIVGTGMGCKADSDTFLENLLEDENLLSPTKFIQSTHNTVAGQLAILLACKAYNMTFVQNSLSFESALIDVQLELNSSDPKHILVGGVDELSTRTEEHLKLIKPEKELNFGEGAHFFLVSNHKTSESIAHIKFVQTSNHLEVEDLKDKIGELLEKNGLQINAIDSLILGFDRRPDDYYSRMIKIFHESAIYTYKDKIGEFYTANAFALWLAVFGFKNKHFPKEFTLKKSIQQELKHVLIYNHSEGKEHSFILVQSP